MAQNRDPAFWRRFSLAIHLDEESKASTPEKEVTLWSYVVSLLPIQAHDESCCWSRMLNVRFSQG
ncbi:hypothetical protein BO99DRAFT_402120 [Aspergillus violaceofuscus CBS 115571]|uniref:Uncharacterized protein n=1 Tax=Aspergillus violaceofuscus (strain CBS 115571) TaxID=1450538 RepID=A0A2V5H7A6_ASPV1|nr:hypothetical protein BO99DRAFT_402120 [Aspergillus violaceofuscus CBS 115571]